MPYELGVLVVHGMGNQQADFANGLIAEVSARLGAKAGLVRWKPAWWAPVLAAREETLLRDLSATNRLDFMELRQFVVHALGDAVAYQDAPPGRDRRNVYDDVHEVIRQAVHELRNELRAGQPDTAAEVPLVVVAHSLGCHIISNHFWDLQRPRHARKPVNDNPFERGETLAGMVTFGCNLPLFTLAYGKLEPIQFPSRTLATYFPPGTDPVALAQATRWINLYDPDDVLGYPLKPLSPQYGATVSEDRAINAGNVLDSWNPISHSGYWTDNDVTKPVAEVIEGLLRLR